MEKSKNICLNGSSWQQTNQLSQSNQSLTFGSALSYANWRRTNDACIIRSSVLHLAKRRNQAKSDVGLLGDLV